jgi:NitT/TauT family transport system ATP-binding protein
MMLQSAQPQISSAGVTKRFDTVTALDNVSLDIRQGEFCAIVGPSGCGKSTLMRIVAGLEPAEGEVRIAGVQVRGPHPDVGVVFQNAVLLPWKTTRENIAFQFQMRAWDPRPYAERIDALIRLAGLSGFENHLPHQLSGGMQQRVSICRALVHDPALLLLDEPFGALDAMTRETMNVELQRIWMESRKTVMMITHGISEAVFLADRVHVMTPRPGRLAATLEVDLPRPRNADTVENPRFRQIAREIRGMLGDSLGLG